MMARLSLLWGSAHRARVLRVLVLLGTALLLGGVLLTFSSWRAASAAQTADSERAALQVAATEADAIRTLGAELAGREAAVWRLRARGFTSPADRVAWVERVTAAARAEQPLRYKVELGADLELPVPLSVQAWYDTRGLAAPRHITNELVLELEGLQEVELQRLLALAREAGGAEVRLERCALERRVDRMGLDARCVLRRHALLAPVSDAAANASNVSRNVERDTFAQALLAANFGTGLAAPLPRVFFASDERSAITAQRRSGKPFEMQLPAPLAMRDVPAPGVIEVTSPASPVTPSPTRARRIDGITLGADARPVAWIGGDRIIDGAQWGPYRVRIEHDGVRLVARDGSVQRVHVGKELPP